MRELVSDSTLIPVRMCVLPVEAQTNRTCRVPLAQRIWVRTATSKLRTAWIRGRARNICVIDVDTSTTCARPFDLHAYCDSQGCRPGLSRCFYLRLHRFHLSFKAYRYRPYRWMHVLTFIHEPSRLTTHDVHGSCLSRVCSRLNGTRGRGRDDVEIIRV